MSTYAQNFELNSDITDELNTALKNNKNVTIPPGDYKVDALKSIKPQNGSVITMSENTRLNVIPNKSGAYKVFDISNVKNVTITGGELIGDKYSHLNKYGEWGMGIDIRDSQNITISNMKISKMWGDAIYLGNNNNFSNSDIVLSNIIMNDNRRQGVSVITAKNLNANNLTIKNTSGTGPASGIAIEPNNNKSHLENLTFKNITTENNKGAGIQITLKFYKNPKNPVSISVINHKDNRSTFGSIVNGIDSTQAGQINFNKLAYKNNSNSNTCFSNWSNTKFNIKFTEATLDGSKGVSEWCHDVSKNKRILVQKN
jgi:hypothetical protein